MNTCYPMIRKDRINKKGFCTVQIRITCNRKSSYIPTSIKIKPSQWNDEKQTLKKSVQNYNASISLINNYLSRINEVFIAKERKGQRIDSKLVKNLILNNNREDLIEYMKDWIERRLSRNEITYGSWLRYTAVINKIAQAFPGNISIEEFDSTFVKKFEDKLRIQFNNSINTIASNLSFLRAVANQLIKDDKMNLNNNPFKNISLKFEEVKRKYLLPEQIKEVENILLPPNSKLELSRDIFVFCTQTGFRIGDALLLKEEHFNGSHFEFISQKTKTHITLLCTEKAKSILERVSNQNSTSPYIFNFLTVEKQDNKKEAFKQQKSVTAFINKNLGIISERLGFDFSVSTHYARHSLATNALTNGLSLEQIKAILHHRNIKTTEIYAKAADQMKDEAMKKIG